MDMSQRGMPWWAWVWPLLAWALLGSAIVTEPSALLLGAATIVLIATVFASVFHAEVVAHRVGEPFGTLVLALAVTVIEVALIVSVMISGGAAKTELARDTVFAAVMIICNGLVGLCLLSGGVRHHVQGFQLQGALAALAVLAALVTLTLVLPNFVGTPGPIFTTPQLLFSAAASLTLYGAFVFVQTVRHRDYFLPEVRSGDENVHAAPPSGKVAIASFGLLLACLVVVVGLAKVLTPTLERGINDLGIPKTVAGIVIAALVLMPEGLAALRAARVDRLQTSMNLALGSALASIGLTIPAVALVSVLTDQPLSLGLGSKDQLLLALTLLVSVITLGTGRTTVLQGIVHLVIFASFLFFALVP
ncbi:calcium:proton antiporter [Methylobacterium flocculans]|uniref:calcium:proton antiporter n=1 Tax=Methylobacterium flocculans TaxID=2984843 RepID=UPI0021F289A7|nr:ionic transporter y4hA [Methylobacterium sp. FF17]